MVQIVNPTAGLAEILAQLGQTVATFVNPDAEQQRAVQQLVRTNPEALKALSAAYRDRPIEDLQRLAGRETAEFIRTQPMDLKEEIQHTVDLGTPEAIDQLLSNRTPEQQQIVRTALTQAQTGLTPGALAQSTAQARDASRQSAAITTSLEARAVVDMSDSEFANLINQYRTEIMGNQSAITGVEARYAEPRAEQDLQQSRYKTETDRVRARDASALSDNAVGLGRANLAVARFTSEYLLPRAIAGLRSIDPALANEGALREMAPNMFNGPDAERQFTYSMRLAEANRKGESDAFFERQLISDASYYSRQTGIATNDWVTWFSASSDQRLNSNDPTFNRMRVAARNMGAAVLGRGIATGVNSMTSIIRQIYPTTGKQAGKFQVDIARGNLVGLNAALSQMQGLGVAPEGFRYEIISPPEPGFLGRIWRFLDPIRAFTPSNPDEGLELGLVDRNGVTVARGQQQIDSIINNGTLASPTTLSRAEFIQSLNPTELRMTEFVDAQPDSTRGRVIDALRINNPEFYGKLVAGGYVFQPVQ